MMHPTRSLRFRRSMIAALLLVFSASACGSPLPRSGGTAGTPAEVVTLEATSLVTRDVTREVTRQVVVPVTVTPTNTPLYTFTPSETSTITTTPTITPTPGPPEVIVLEYTDCLYGPESFFLYKTSLPAAASMEVVGRNPQGSWLDVEEVHGWDPCWIPAALVRFKSGSVETVPVRYPNLPYSYWYKPPNPVAHREGNEVTVTWKAVWMAEDDYRGYLIIAWVCQGGAYVYVPLAIDPPYAENTGTFSVTIEDQAGCSGFSEAHIYSAEKRGYSGELIFWPQP
jgi:hypothetical protein